jgi:predicted aldo/keto reductase-like oxidoreductase
MDAETRTWADKNKSEGKIRLFGFSTHSNMEACLHGASKLGWIDGIMMSYNYRLMHTNRMQKAVDACIKAGIGLTAMKTQGGGSVSADTDAARKLAGRFLKKGFTAGQAKLKAVWENPGIASICSEMPSIKILKDNVAAALNRTKLAARETAYLQAYAGETRSDYCAGCSEICQSAVGGTVAIGDIMRCLMYARSYGDRDRAAATFNGIPETVRQYLLNVDYSPAERKCPQCMAIGRLMGEAVEEFL